MVYKYNPEIESDCRFRRKLHNNPRKIIKHNRPKGLIKIGIWQ